MLNKRVSSLVLVGSLGLGGCATQGVPERIQAVAPYGTVTILAPSQMLGDRYMKTDDLKLIVAVRGEPNEKQLATVAAVEKACQETAMTVHPNIFVSGITDGIVQGGIGALAQGVAAEGAYTDAANRINNYPLFGLAYSGIFGVLTGPLNENASRNDTVRRCGSTVMSLFPEAAVRVIVKSPR